MNGLRESIVAADPGGLRDSVTAKRDLLYSLDRPFSRDKALGKHSSQLNGARDYKKQ